MVPLRVRGLVKRYGSTVALAGVSLDAPAGRVTALLGPNGAGKTSLVECCEGLRRPTAGTVELFGRPAGTDRRADVRARIGVMLQDGGLPPSARVESLLRHVARMFAAPWDPADLLERLGLRDLARHRVRRLSGGQRQRVALACAVVGRPELLFLDEPSAGLDPQARLAVWQLIGELRDHATAIVLTTHAMAEAERLADEVHIVDRGRVVAHGSPAELVSAAGAGRPADHMSFRAAGLDRDALADALEALGGPLDVAALGGDRFRVTGAIGPEVVAAVTACCARRGIMPADIDLGRRTLEDVFLDLTGRALR